MKMYKVIIDPKAQKQLKKMDYMQAKIISKWIKNNLVGCSNPYFSGKRLKGNLNDFWRYRVGNYRILTIINDDEIIINVVKIAHRQSVYDN